MATEPYARHGDVGLSENSRPSGHTRVHALPTAPARGPGMTYDRNGG